MNRRTLGAIIGICIALLIFKNIGSPSINAIDTHEHIETLNKAEILKIANKNSSIEKTILLPSPIETITLNGNNSFTDYRKNVDEILAIAQKYPDKFIPLCTISPLDPDALEYFDDCIKRGGKGLKLYNGHSYYYEVFKQPLDSARMMPIYAYAERNKIPILYHINITKYGSELENILNKYPDLVISIPHFMVSSINIQQVEEMFDKYPNLYTDVSFGSPQFMAAGLRRISNNSQKYTDFINKFPDRILFGTDMVITEVGSKDLEFMEKTLQCYRDMLEKESYICKRANEYYKNEAEKYIKIADDCKPQEGKYCKSQNEKADSFYGWYTETKRLKGLNLSNKVLKKIYQENPLRFLSGNSI
ncbi:amidohydrolase family protein [Candidatus Peregrinibacteria bacterium]|nr:amidohydrolase family protein [Candidatus Peregrinibacteria bacterium]